MLPIEKYSFYQNFKVFFEDFNFYDSKIWEVDGVYLINKLSAT